MYRHILVATDGSKLSARATDIAAQLGKAMHAKLSGVYVILTYAPSIFTEGIWYGTRLSSRQYKDATEREARQALRKFEVRARKAGVTASTLAVVADEPWQGILDTARAQDCDLVVMAAHGRRGVAGLLIGSETAKVLAHSKIPVLVCR